VWQFVFPAARKMLQLTYLYLGDTDTYLPDTEDMAAGGAAGIAVRPSWGAADFTNLVSCCPGLRDIECMHLQPETHGRELQQLTALQSLTRLCVCYGPEVPFYKMSMSLDGLTAVTQLRSLLVTALGEEVTYAGVLPLTRLTALTALRLDSDWGFDCDAFESKQVRTVTTVFGLCTFDVLLQVFVLLYLSLSDRDKTLVVQKSHGIAISA
jgi:hypothetical protein